MRNITTSWISRLALVVGIGVAAASAQAGGVNWSISVNAPIAHGPGYVSTTVGNHRAHPVHVWQPPVRVYHAPPPPPRVIVVPARPHGAHHWKGHGPRGHHAKHHGGRDRWDDRRGHRHR